MTELSTLVNYYMLGVEFNISHHENSNNTIAHGEECKRQKADIKAAPKLTSGTKAKHRVTREEIVALLRMGPVVENAERAAKTRMEKGPKGHCARIAFDTLEILASGGYDVPGHPHRSISDQVSDSIASSEIYKECTWQDERLPAPRYRNKGVTEVWCSTTLHAARELYLASGFPPGVLNFASARNPGGGFSTGAQAQEETLARSSALYPCLTKFFEEFFIPGRKAPSGAYTHDIIHSPKVSVFKDDQGSLLVEPYTADFVTAAAPNKPMIVKSKGRQEGDREAASLLHERVKRILSVLAQHGAVDVVLGAWGCGVFGNDPVTVADIFREHLQGDFHGCFRRIIFAVKDPKMANVFADTFRVEVVAAAE